MRSNSRMLSSSSTTRMLAAIGACFGAGGPTRTGDLLITNQLLYQLSYTSKCAAKGAGRLYAHVLQRGSRVNLFLYTALRHTVRSAIRAFGRAALPARWAHS